MNTHPHTRPHFAQYSHLQPVAQARDADDELLVEVDFKWLMAGQGWWVDTLKLKSDPDYARHWMLTALDSPCAELRNCARCLQDELARLA